MSDDIVDLIPDMKRIIRDFAMRVSSVHRTIIIEYLEYHPNFLYPTEELIASLNVENVALTPTEHDSLGALARTLADRGYRFALENWRRIAVDDAPTSSSACAHPMHKFENSPSTRGPDYLRDRLPTVDD